MKNLTQGCKTLVCVCANLKPNERVLVISDTNTRLIGDAIVQAASQITRQVSHRVIEPFSIHGEEPDPEIAAEMARCDVIFGVTRMSMAHSEARKSASEAGARYLSLPDYSPEVLTRPAINADFRALTSVAQRLAEVLTRGNEITFTTDLGTNFTCDIKNRVANAAPGWCWGPGTLASPPDAETNIAPIEDSSTGIVVVDGSIPCAELGLLQSPLQLTIAQGRIAQVQGQQSHILDEVFDRLGNPATRVVAEFGIGLNPLAELGGMMLEDEGCLGTVHLGIGSNSTVGGKNKVPFHLDHIVRRATVLVDGHKIIDNGAIAEEIAG